MYYPAGIRNLLLISLFLSPVFTLAQEADDIKETVAAAPALIEDESILPPEYKVSQLEGDIVYGDFVVGPGKFELEMSAGEAKTVVLNVSNRTGADQLFNLSVEDATGSDDPNTPVVLLGDDTGPYTLKDYIKIPDDKFIIKHNTKVSIPITVELPKDAEPGGRYGSVLVSVTAPGSNGADGVAPRSAVISRIGTLFFVTSPGLETRSGELTHFGTVPEGKKWYKTAPIRFGLLYKNDGSVHVNPYGEIKIKNIFGAEIGTVEVDPWYALPESVRLREVTFNKNKMFGRYTATAVINKGYNDLWDTEDYVFYVVNWWLLLGGFVGAFVFIWLLRLFLGQFELKRKV